MHKSIQTTKLLSLQESAVRSFQILSKTPIIPDDFGPTGPLEECAGLYESKAAAEGDKIPAVIVDDQADDLQVSTTYYLYLGTGIMNICLV